MSNWIIQFQVKKNCDFAFVFVNPSMGESVHANVVFKQLLIIMKCRSCKRLQNIPFRFYFVRYGARL